MRQSATPPARLHRINLRTSPELHRELKMEAARQGVTLQELVERWLREKLQEAQR